MLKRIFRRSKQIRIFQVFNSSIVIEWKGKTIYVNPQDDPESFTAYPRPDLVLITHAGADFSSDDPLKEIDFRAADLIAPKGVADMIGHKIDVKGVKVLNHGESMIWRKIKIEALPTYKYGSNQERLIHDLGNGYLLEIRNKKIYISGDTQEFPDKSKLASIDIAFFGLMASNKKEVQKSADAVLELKPKVLYPYLCCEEQGDVKHIHEFKSIINQSSNIEVRLADWHTEN